MVNVSLLSNKMIINTLILSVKKWTLHISLSLLLLQVSCVAQQSASSTGNEPYNEDLTGERVVYKTEEKDSSNATANLETPLPQTVPATMTVNKKVDSVLDSLDKLNQFRKFVDGLTIQIYSGQNREEAIAARSKMVTEIDDMEASVQYKQPKFIVTTGQYFTKLEAQKDLMRVKYHFPNAILVPEKIPIK